MQPDDGIDYSNDQQIGPGLVEMRYLDAYRFIFQSPKWLTNVLLSGVCMLVAGIIPIVPQLVLMGYQFEIIEALHRRPNQMYPDFDLNRLADYLTRGMWPFLVTFVASFVLIPVGFVLMFGFMAIFGSVMAAGASTTVTVLIGALLVIVLIALSVLAGIVSVPMSLRAGLAQDFAAGFDFEFIKSFVSRVGLELLLTWLFLIASGFILTIVGFLACFIGAFVSVALWMLAQGHLMYQLYELYLSRGGAPIPLKTDARR
ncbi:MAG: DUF4013 domain-containing protein [Planctomycetaceae bacterium]